MDPVTKIGTCCYCGTRAVLTLRGRERHELTCTSCGAPLHNMKQMKVEPKPRPAVHVPRIRKPQKVKPMKRKAQKQRKRRGFGYWVREAFDELEDLFD